MENNGNPGGTPPGGSPDNNSKKHSESKVIPVSGLYQNWFLDYASYVILERAVPAIEDGLKPVQRRILHSMWELEDGRYNKVANIIGNTMKFHPHGDVSIGDALVQMGQKDLLIDTQGNWGNIYTGDSAAASRYIEARLSRFALEVVFNPKTTVWQTSYDGRNREPVTLPVKFPLLLATGAEGIAVGMACKVLPHNFNELIDASIAILRGKSFSLVPDFATGGIADFSRYNEGLRGGRVRVRAKIEKRDKKSLAITQIPFNTTTGSLIDSILAANDKGKIKVKKVEDNTAAEVEILIQLHPDMVSDLDKTIDALYAFTDCEISISPNNSVILRDKPHFFGVNEMLEMSTSNTVALLREELDIKKRELEEEWHFMSLEKIFIENRIYRDIEEVDTWEGVLDTIDIGLKPFVRKLKRAVTRDDITRLTEIKIKRISRFDAFKANEKIKSLEEQISQINYYLKNLTAYAIDYFKELKKKYGKGRERKTEIASFENIVATDVVASNQKLYVNREDGFAGYAMKKDEFVCECSDIDDIIVFRADGTMLVTKVAEKSFVGKNVLFINVFKKGGDNTVYNMVYQDGPKGAVMVKRYTAGGITRDKEYNLTKGTAGSKVLYFKTSGESDAEKLQIVLKPRPRLKIRNIDIDLNEQLIKGRSAQGNIITKFPITKLIVKDGPKQAAVIATTVVTTSATATEISPKKEEIKAELPAIKLKENGDDDEAKQITFEF